MNNEGKAMHEEMQSEYINELADALSKAQGMIEGATKDSVNPFHKSKYADLHSVIACAKEPLAQNGLSVVQPTQMIDGQLCLITILMHKSGQWIKSIVPLISDKQDAQSMGKTFTYYRRYAYSSLLNISQYDDDAEEAMQRELNKAKEKPKAEPKQASQPTTPASQLPIPETVPVGPKKYTLKDLTDRILAEKHKVADVGAVSAMIAQKSKEMNKAIDSLIQSIMKSPENFEGFYVAYQHFVSKQVQTVLANPTPSELEEVPF
jgi:cell pole-organizing protein PopZ